MISKKKFQTIQWVLRGFAAALLAGAFTFFIGSVIELRLANASLMWSKTKGRILSLEVGVLQEREKETGKQFTRFRPLVSYEWDVAGARHCGMRVSFTGWGGSTGARFVTTESEARTFLDRYPEGGRSMCFTTPMILLRPYSNPVLPQAIGRL